MFPKRRSGVAAPSKAKRGAQGGLRVSTAASPDGQSFYRTLLGSDPFPPSMHRKFQYAETFSFSTGTAGVLGTEQVMRLNSLFDPNKTGTGHQPYGYDQLLGVIYGYYRVQHADVEILFTTPGSTADIYCAALVSGKSNTLSLTGMTLDRATEIPRVASAHLSTSGTRAAVIRFSVPIHVLFGVSRSVVANDDGYASFNTTNPANEATCSFSVGSYSGAAGETVTAQFKVTYSAVIYDRIGLAQS